MITFNLDFFSGKGEFPFFIQYGYHEFSLYEHDHADFFELTTVLKGTAMHNIGDESCFVKKGDVFCVNDQTAHSFTECHDFRICNIMFRPGTMFAAFPELSECEGFSLLFDPRPHISGSGALTNRMRLNLSDFEQAKAMTDAMAAEYNSRKPARNAALTAQFISFVCFLVRRYEARRSETDTSTAFSRAVAYIENHFSEKITLDEIAAIAGLSVRQFQRQFANTYLTTTSDYITALRMQKAMLMLTKTDDSIGNIAGECGFSDPAFFTRSFTKYTGYSPRRFREEENRMHDPYNI